MQATSSLNSGPRRQYCKVIHKYRALMPSIHSQSTVTDRRQAGHLSNGLSFNCHQMADH